MFIYFSKVNYNEKISYYAAYIRRYLQRRGRREEIRESNIFLLQIYYYLTFAPKITHLGLLSLVEKVSVVAEVTPERFKV